MGRGGGGRCIGITIYSVQLLGLLIHRSSLRPIRVSIAWKSLKNAHQDHWYECKEITSAYKQS